MRGFALAIGVALAGPAPLSAQDSVIIDLNEKPDPFSETDYSALLACTLEKHPDETRRYADYHLNRRDIQTPEQNVADPDSKLAMPVISACFEFQNGKPIPFSLDRLIGDWASHHEVDDTTGVRTIDEFAVCAVRSNPSFAQGYVNTYRSSSQRKIQTLSLLIRSMNMPPCTIRGDSIQIEFNELYDLLDRELRASRGDS